MMLTCTKPLRPSKLLMLVGLPECSTLEVCIDKKLQQSTVCFVEYSKEEEALLWRHYRVQFASCRAHSRRWDGGFVSDGVPALGGAWSMLGTCCGIADHHRASYVPTHSQATR